MSNCPKCGDLLTTGGCINCDMVGQSHDHYGVPTSSGALPEPYSPTLPSIKKMDRNVPFVLKSNHHHPIEILGVAEARIEGVSGTGYMLMYKAGDVQHQAQIDEDTYRRLRTIFDTIKEINEEEISRWAQQKLQSKFKGGM